MPRQPRLRLRPPPKCLISERGKRRKVKESLARFVEALDHGGVWHRQSRRGFGARIPLLAQPVDILAIVTAGDA